MSFVGTQDKAAAASVDQATGKAVTRQPVSEAQFQEGMTSAGVPEGYVALMTGLYQAVRAGHSAAVTNTVEQVAGRVPISFEQFARDHKDVWL